MCSVIQQYLLYLVWNLGNKFLSENKNTTQPAHLMFELPTSPGNPKNLRMGCGRSGTGPRDCKRTRLTCWGLQHTDMAMATHPPTSGTALLSSGGWPHPPFPFTRSHKHFKNMANSLGTFSFRNRNTCHSSVCACVFSLLELPLSNREKSNQVSEDSMYGLGCTQVNFSNRTRFLLPLFVRRWGGRCTRRHIQTHAHTRGLQLHKQGKKISENTWRGPWFLSAQGCLTSRQQTLSDGMLVSQGQGQGTQHLGRSREPLRWRSGEVQRGDFRLPHGELSKNRCFALFTKTFKSVCLGLRQIFLF